MPAMLRGSGTILHFRFSGCTVAGQCGRFARLPCCTWQNTRFC